MSKPQEYSLMTKDKLMIYTFAALAIIAAVTIVLWWDVNAIDAATGNQIGLNYGLTVLLQLDLQSVSTFC